MPDSEAGMLPGDSHRVCLIGAGVSGPVAAKVFREHGRKVVVIERGPELGGMWAPSNCYPEVRTQTPRDLYCFSDFPMRRPAAMLWGSANCRSSMRLCGRS